MQLGHVDVVNKVRLLKIDCLEPHLQLNLTLISPLMREMET
jgi:hypothetical protein